MSAFPIEAGIDTMDLLHHDRIIQALEHMSPFWEPGTQFLYAPFTYGFLVAEVVRRITGKTLGTVLREEITGPLNLDLWFGLPEELEERIMPNIVPEPDTSALPKKIDPNHPLVAAYTRAFQRDQTYELFNTREGHAAEVPGANGIGDARSLAKFYAHMIGEVEGKPRILKKETLERAIQPQTDNLPFAKPFDALFKQRSYRFALGFQRNSPVLPMIGPTSFGHVGSGGRLAFADLDSGLAVAYICNNPLWNSIQPDRRWVPWLHVLRKLPRD
jgi:CubicO group peptidase (beta-lactamase class C family)